MGAAAPDGSLRTMVDFRVHAQSQPRWADSLWREPVGACANQADAARPAATGRCIANYVMVRNDEPAPIVCRVAVGLTLAPGKQADSTFDAIHTVMPGHHEAALVVMSTRGQLPAEYAAECYPAGPSIEATVQTVSRCLSKFDVTSSRSINYYYPPESMSFREEGESIVQFFVDGESGKVVRSSLFESSGSSRLDKAAIKMAGDLRGKGMCADFPYRVVINWSLRDQELRNLRTFPVAR